MPDSVWPASGARLPDKQVFLPYTMRHDRHACLGVPVRNAWQECMAGLRSLAVSSAKLPLNALRA